MSELHLWFSYASSLELYKTRFLYPEFDLNLSSVRGRDSGAHGSTGSFPFSSAVQGLSIILINAYLGAATPHISGYRGSHASSLDYSITKQTTWLAEMFGSLPSGELFAKRLFKRSNTHLKRPGPVSISLNFNIINADDIVIYINGEVVKDKEALRRIYDSEYIKNHNTSNTIQTNAARSSLSIELFTDKSQENIRCFSEKLLYWIREESNRTLFETDIFTEYARNIVSQKYLTSTIINGYLGKKVSCLSRLLQLGVNTSSYTPTSLKQISLGIPKIRLRTTIAQIGTLCIFYALRSMYNLNIEIDIESSDTLRILNDDSYLKLDDETITITTLASGATVTAIKNSTYDIDQFLMIAPGVSYKVVTKSHKNIKTSEFLKRSGLNLLQGNNSISTSELYAQTLRSEGMSLNRNSSLSPSEPKEILAKMKSTDEPLSSILWFPHYHINTLLTDSQVSVDLTQFALYKETFLFLSSNGIGLSNFLKSLIEDVWLELRVNPKLRSEICRSIASSQDYIHAVLKISGLHSYIANSNEQVWQTDLNRKSI
jgi:hypothetical protein